MSEKVDFSIEFAHIYLDQIPGSEQTESLKILGNKAKELEKLSKTFNKVILIDDFTPEKTILKKEEYIESVKKDTDLDFVALESQLAMFAHKFIEEIKKEFVETKVINGIETKTFRKGQESIGLITNNNKPSCTLLIAIWYLCRLGIYGVPAKTQSFSDKSFVGRKLITIIPEKYKEGEEKVLKLLKETKYNYLIKDIEQIYF